MHELIYSAAFPLDWILDWIASNECAGLLCRQRWCKLQSLIVSNFFARSLAGAWTM